MNGNTNIKRKLYTEKLAKYIGLPLVKVIIGMRRSGKSALLDLFGEELLKTTDENHLIYINFEDMAFDFITDHKKLNEYVMSKITDDEKYYIFLDEIQNIEHWEICVNSLRLRNTDIYITGSNSKLLSSELSTLLAGRYVEFHLYTLSFEEFIDFRNEYGIGSGNVDEELKTYIQIGGFPIFGRSAVDVDTARKIITDINGSAVLRDVVRRYNIRNIQLLQKVIDFIYDNIGNITSAKSIWNHFVNEHRSAEYETIYNYIQYLEDAQIIHKIKRYDIRGKKLLETMEKYYLAEHSLQYSVRKYNADNISGILENIVCMELLRRGFAVSVGKFGNKEVDFVADGPNGKVYVQVCYLFAGKETIDREFAPLMEIKDNYPKLVVTMDNYWKVERNGVKGMHLKEFLLSEHW